MNRTIKEICINEKRSVLSSEPIEWQSLQTFNNKKKKATPGERGIEMKRKGESFHLQQYKKKKESKTKNVSCVTSSKPVYVLHDRAGLLALAHTTLNKWTPLVPCRRC